MGRNEMTALALSALIAAWQLCAGEPMTCSWYGGQFHGRQTANGERFDMNALTAAHRTLPFNTTLTVCSPRACVNVRINDRGPYVRDPITRKYTRDLDLAYAAFAAVADPDDGTTTVWTWRNR